MYRPLVILFAIAACSSPPASHLAALGESADACGTSSEPDALLEVDAPAPPPPCGPSVDSETYEWQVRAAMLDPRAYVHMRDTGHSLDFHVPAGHTWFVINAFQLKVGDIADGSLRIKSEWAPPAFADTGYLRVLDVNHALALPAGTHVRYEAQEVPDASGNYWPRNGSALYFADPAGIFAVDPRYCSDPRGLYYQRKRQLDTTLPLRMTIVESFSGGDYNRDVWRYVDDPTDPGDDYDAAMIVGISEYEATWCTIGSGDNLLPEINNNHTVRFADAVTAPIWRGGMAAPVGATGLQIEHWPGLMTDLPPHVPAALTGESARLTLHPGTYSGASPQVQASTHGSCAMMWKKIPVTNPWSW